MSTFECANIFCVCQLCFFCTEEHETILESKKTHFLLVHYTQKMPCNSIPFLGNLLEILGLLMKFTIVFHHFWHFTNMPLTSPTKVTYLDSGNSSFWIHVLLYVSGFLLYLSLLPCQLVPCPLFQHSKILLLKTIYKTCN